VRVNRADAGEAVARLGKTSIRRLRIWRDFPAAPEETLCRTPVRGYRRAPFFRP